ncbi:hypothetical protein RAA17_08040 [Komagataeibacter rhaeticus]|nr:hypothetical protein [Komagataeibacter rhaeticus]
MVDDTSFTIRAGRHPVVEAALPRNARFTPNDCDLEPDHRIMLLSGPNMAGKSTFCGRRRWPSSWRRRGCQWRRLPCASGWWTACSRAWGRLTTLRAGARPSWWK